jgi:protein-arginine kinase activator protein McsA
MLGCQFSAVFFYVLLMQSFLGCHQIIVKSVLKNQFIMHYVRRFQACVCNAANKSFKRTKTVGCFSCPKHYNQQFFTSLRGVRFQEAKWI